LKCICLLTHFNRCYGASPFISPNGICIFGDSLEDHIVAQIIPQKTYIETWMVENQITDKTYTEMLTDERLLSAIEKNLKKLAKDGKKKSFEEVGDNFKLYDEEWTPENEMLTAAMKLNRQNIYKKNADDLKALYAKNKK
jgi:long-chain acyl-CoA synthetase